VAGTDGIVERRNPLIVGRTGIGYLHGRLLDQLQFPLQTGVQQENITSKIEKRVLSLRFCIVN